MGVAPSERELDSMVKFVEGRGRWNRKRPSNSRIRNFLKLDFHDIIALVRGCTLRICARHGQGPKIRGKSRLVQKFWRKSKGENGFGLSTRPRMTSDLTSQLSAYNLACTCADLTVFVVNTSPPPPLITTSKLADCFSSDRPSESANSKTRRDTVGLSRLQVTLTVERFTGSSLRDERWRFSRRDSIISLPLRSCHLADDFR
jgi:hypothetical protein